MSAVRITVAVPTLGHRATLACTLAELAMQLGPLDDVIVAVDEAGDVENAHRVFVSFANRRWRFHVMPGGIWGHHQRNWALDNAPGTHVWSLNDDDTPAAGALETLRAYAHPSRAVIFKALFPDGTTFWGQPAGYREPEIWRDRSIRLGNVDAAMILAPARIRSRWGLRYEGDFDFAAALVDELGAPVWRDEIVVHKG